MDLAPATSSGFDLIEWGEKLRRPLLPWQQWAAIHAGELLPDGRPRFEVVLILVARQNGKTELPVVASTYWQFAERVPMILGTSTKLNYAQESWQKAVDLVEQNKDLLGEHHPERWTRIANGEQESWTHPAGPGRPRSRYKISAANSDAGRSLTVWRLILDELRQHTSYVCWDAAIPTMAAVPARQAWCLSNAGTDSSIVLNDLVASAREWIDTGEGDPRLGIFAWLCDPDDDPTDPAALAKANPSPMVDLESLARQGARALRLGGGALSGFQTENMCVTAGADMPAIEPIRWARCAGAVDLRELRSPVAAVLDMSPDAEHVTLAAAARVPGSDAVMVDLVADWSGPGADVRAVAELPAVLAPVRPRVLGWIPSGPGAALVGRLARPTSGPGAHAYRAWLPPGTVSRELRGEVPGVCMGFAAAVRAGRIIHGNDPLLNAQVRRAVKARQGRRWVFDAPEGAHVDAVYATAGAVTMAEQLPPGTGTVKVISSGR